METMSRAGGLVIFLLAITVLLVTACATRATQPFGDQHTEFTIACGGADQSWNRCNDLAMQRCGGAYEVLKRYDFSTTVHPPQSGGDGFGVVNSIAYERSMSVACKNH